MHHWTIKIAVLALVSLIAVAAAEAAGSKPVNPPTAPTPPTGMSPEESGRLDYNTGLKLRDKAWKLEEKAAASESEEERGKLAEKARKQHKKSIPLFENAVRKVPDFHQALSSLGYALRKTGDYDAALEAYGQALEISPDYGEAIEYRAEAYLGLGRVEDAKQAYVRLFSLDRALADELMEAMHAWLEARRVDPAGVSSETLDGFASWLQERSELAAQTARLTEAAERAWGD